MSPSAPDRRTRGGGRRRRPAPLRAGVIGAGRMGRNHARALAHLGGLCELHGIHDTDAARATAAAGEYETRAYRELDALLADVDVVTIASPSACHLEHALRAIEAGRHVLVEKPVALSVADARRIAAAAATRPAQTVAVGHIEHFNPAIRELRKLLDGTPVIAVDIHRLSPFDGRITDADVVQDLMLHDIHVVLSIAGRPPVHVQTAGRAVRSPAAWDYAAAHLLFADGMIASLSASRVTEEKIRRLSATTAEAHITADLLQRTIEVCRWTRLDSDPRDARAYRQESVVERIFVPQEEPLLAELAAFLRAARDGAPAEVGPADGVRCLEVIDRVRSADPFPMSTSEVLAA